MEVSDGASRLLSGLLEQRTGQQLTTGRRWRIGTALAGLLRARGFGTLDALISVLIGGREPRLADEVVEALLNNETSFFRDRAPFQLLRDEVLPTLAALRAHERRLSVWCAGVSTGQEAYSLAMTFAEDPARWAGWTIDILGTDVSAAAIARANGGVYSQFEIGRGLPVVQLVRWFDKTGEEWRIAKPLARAVRFRVHSVLSDPPPPGRFDLVLCRNLLLYFTADVRRAAFARLADAAAPDGLLMLGAGETVIGQTDRFAADPAARGLYRACPASADATRSADPNAILNETRRRGAAR